MSSVYAEAAKEVRTNQGGIAHTAPNRLERFLILGSDSNTYYASAKQLTIENVNFLLDELDSGNGFHVVNTIVSISKSGRAPSNEPALIALAFCAAYRNEQKIAYAQQVRQYALARLSDVARTSTHLFHFLSYSQAAGRGWGSAFKTAVRRWYLDRSEQSLVNQVTKYKSRDGWSHKDVLWLAHPKAEKSFQDKVFSYVTRGVTEKLDGDEYAVEYILEGVEKIKNATDESMVIDAISKYQLPWEVVPTQLRTSARVWEALVPHMGYTALLRNLGTLASVGYLTEGSNGEDRVIERLNDTDALKAARVHPLDVLKAKLVFESGHGFRGKNTWNATNNVVNLLESAFYESFNYVEPSNTRLLFGLDVSSSMKMPNSLNNVPNFSPRVASAVLALTMVKTEPKSAVMAFSKEFVPFEMDASDTLESVITKMEKMPFGATDCALPIAYAIKHRLLVDGFLIYTDSETGGRNPSALLREYRAMSELPNSKMVVNAMVANKFTIADPNDPNMLDVAGFDSSVPALVSDFLKN